jgi:DNA-binding NarL/FixJ family response regulator
MSSLAPHLLDDEPPLRGALGPVPLGPDGGGPTVDTGAFGVLVLDPSQIVGLGLRALLAQQPWAERCVHAATLAAAEQLVRRYEPRVALVSTAFTDMAAGDAALRLQALQPGLRVIVMAAANDSTRCWGHPVGAWGWMEREWPAAQVLEVIAGVGAGRRMMPTSRAPRLTAQQLAVLRLISRGSTNREIALELGLSPNTVKEYAGAVFRRLDARNRAEAVRRAQRWGIIN